VDRVRLAQLEEANLRLEARSVFATHLVGPRHRAEGRREGAARGVFEGLPGVQDRLLAHHSRAVHLFGLSSGIEDQPVAVGQLDLLIRLVRDRDRVEEEPAALARIGVPGSECSGE